MKKKDMQKRNNDTQEEYSILRHRAIESHKENKLEEAIRYYSKCIDMRSDDAELISNYCVVLRTKGRKDEALELLKKSFTLGRENANFMNNYGNALRDNEEIESAINVYRECMMVAKGEVRMNACISLATLLNQRNMPRLAMDALKSIKMEELKEKGLRVKYFLCVIDAKTRLDSEKIVTIEEMEETNKLYNLLLQNIDKADDDEKLRGTIMFASHYAKHGDIDKSLDWYSKGVDVIKRIYQKGGKLSKSFKEVWISCSWNISIWLLKKGEFKAGWKLYDYGLLVKADGPQKWQRSMRKPFSYTEVSLIENDNKLPLKGKKVLVLGEQGIGDTMMFMRLVNSFEKKYHCTCSLLIDKRLEGIYSRNKDWDVYTDDSIRRKNSSEFDFQIPCGSLPKFINKDEFGEEIKKERLYVNDDFAIDLRRKYVGNEESNKKIIGLSWQGGGRPKRIQEKSIKLKGLLANLLEWQDNVSFVSLQYGNAGKVVHEATEKTGVKVIYDESINALSDMDGWLSQVSACDAVVTIANTTVHGCGALGVNTFVLLGKEFDWRWQEIEGDVQESYWYDNMEIGLQQKDGEWTMAMLKLKKWLAKTLK